MTRISHDVGKIPNHEPPKSSVLKVGSLMKTSGVFPKSLLYLSGYPEVVAGTPILWPAALVPEENYSLSVIILLDGSCEPSWPRNSLCK